MNEPELHQDSWARLESPQYRFVGYLLGEPADGPEPDPWLRRTLEDVGQFTGTKEYMHLTVG